MKKSSSILLIIILTLSLTTVIALAAAQSPVEIQTDKQDYGPSETVIITGTGYTQNGQVTIQVVAPISDYDKVWVITAEDDGSLTTSYGPPLVQGQYTLTATDIETQQTVTITFTDKVWKNIYVSVATGGTVMVKDDTRNIIVGIVNPGESKLFTVLSGDKVTLTAVPQSGFTFAYWTGEISGNTNPQQKEVGNGIGTKNSPEIAVFVPIIPAPESPLGALAALSACLVGFVVFKKRSALHF
jgi:hypothetical protein